MNTLSIRLRDALATCGAKAVYGEPRGFEALPLLVWRESESRCHACADGAEYLTELKYALDIYASGPEAAEAALAEADAALNALGLRREMKCAIFESDPAMAHLSARYRALADPAGRIWQ